MIQDSVTIIVLGNKYNRAIYDAKQIAAVFQPTMVIEDEEKGANTKDDLIMNVEPDSLSPNKVDLFISKDSTQLPPHETDKKE